MVSSNHSFLTISVSAKLNGFKYSYQTQIIWTLLHGFKYSYQIKIIFFHMESNIPILN